VSFSKIVCRLTTRSTGPAGTGLLSGEHQRGGPVNLALLGPHDLRLRCQDQRTRTNRGVGVTATPHPVSRRSLATAPYSPPRFCRHRAGRANIFWSGGAPTRNSGFGYSSRLAGASLHRVVAGMVLCHACRVQDGRLRSAAPAVGLPFRHIVLNRRTWGLTARSTGPAGTGLLLGQRRRRRAG
jgi:hypothetical protein